MPAQVALRRDQLALKRGIEDEEGANNEAEKGDGKPTGKAKAKAKGKAKAKSRASAKSKGKASETPLADPEPESKLEGEPTAKRAKRTASKGGKKKSPESPEHEIAPAAAPTEADPPVAEQQPLPESPQPAPMEANPPLAEKADATSIPSVVKPISKAKPRRASSSSCSSKVANPPSERRTRVSKGSKKEKDEPKGENALPEGCPGDVGGEKKAAKSFARRARPKSVPGAIAKWDAIKGAFNELIRPHVSVASYHEVRVGFGDDTLFHLQVCCPLF